MLRRLLLAISLLLALTFASLETVSFSAESQPPELRELLQKIDTLCNRNDFERALPFAEIAVRRYPQSYEARCKRGFVLVGLDEETKGIEDYLWALKQRPNDAKFFTIFRLLISNWINLIWL